MTVILVCIAVALVLAVVGALLLRSGAREERGLVPAQAPGAATPRVQRRPPEPDPAPRPEPATAAAQMASGADPDEVRAAGHARLEAALARARARLEVEQKAPQS